MNALEFSTRIEKGLIKVPSEFKNLENSFVRIIILSEENADAAIDKKEKLSHAFKSLQKIKSLHSIENPGDWQKRLRDEWE